jgi:hypothetical protein
VTAAAVESTGYGLSHGILGQNVFSAAVMMVLTTTMITPPLIRLTFPKARRQPTVVLEEAITSIPDQTHPRLESNRT